jgi:NagD protein
MIKVITDMLQLPPAQCIIVGDRLETDIRMGIAAGMATCLVLTGDATRETLVASGLQPTLVLERIDRLLEQIGPQ